jgi:hypothetical protein
VARHRDVDPRGTREEESAQTQRFDACDHAPDAYCSTDRFGCSGPRVPAVTDAEDAPSGERATNVPVGEAGGKEVSPPGDRPVAVEMLCDIHAASLDVVGRPSDRLRQFCEAFGSGGAGEGPGSRKLRTIARFPTPRERWRSEMIDRPQF